MKKVWISGMIALLSTVSGFTQTEGVSISPSNSTPDPSAILDVQSTSKGVLFPRLTSAERDAIDSPATGLIIWNSECGNLNANTGTPESPIWVPVHASSNLPSAPSEATHNAGSGEITWNWNASPGATGYKWNTSTDYNSAIDLSNTTSYLQTGVPICIAPVYVWAYNTCGNSTAIELTQSGPLGCQGNPGANCLAIKTASPSATDGVYWIDPNVNSPVDAFQVYCDMTTDGGGWTYVARGPNLSTSSFGNISTDINQESSWHLSEEVTRTLYTDNQTYQVYAWSNTFDGDRIRIFRPKTDFSLTMPLQEVWNGTSFESSPYDMGSFPGGPHCVLRSNIFDMVEAQSNMHWGYDNASTNYLRCVQEASGETNGLLFIR